MKAWIFALLLHDEIDTVIPLRLNYLPLWESHGQPILSFSLSLSRGRACCLFLIFQRGSTMHDVACLSKKLQWIFPFFSLTSLSFFSNLCLPLLLWNIFVSLVSQSSFYFHFLATVNVLLLRSLCTFHGTLTLVYLCDSFYDRSLFLNEFNNLSSSSCLYNVRNHLYFLNKVSERILSRQ